MKHNAYCPAEVIEIGEAKELICGRKTAFPMLDFVTEPHDRWYDWFG